MMDKTQIGTNAGIVWKLLSDNAHWEYEKLKKESGLSDRDLNAAVAGTRRQNRFRHRRKRRPLILTCQRLYRLTQKAIEYHCMYIQWPFAPLFIRSHNPVYRNIGKIMQHHQKQPFFIRPFGPYHHRDAVHLPSVFIHLVHLIRSNLEAV